MNYGSEADIFSFSFLLFVCCTGVMDIFKLKKLIFSFFLLFFFPHAKLVQKINSIHDDNQDLIFE